MTPIELTFTEQAPLTLGFSQDDPIVLDVGEKQQAANYNELYNKPQIEQVTLEGNKTFAQLGLEAMTVQDIDNMLHGG